MTEVAIIGSGPGTRMLQPAALSLGITLTVAEQLPDDAATVIYEQPWNPTVDGLVVIAARSPQGQAVVYPVTRASGQTFVAPADISHALAEKLQLQALEIIKERNLIGVVAVTFDDTAKVLDVFNGPHRAALWTIDGARTSQFDQHLRAVLNLPFGTPEMTAPLAMTHMVLGGDKPDLLRPFLHLFARDPGLRVHLYGVAVEPGIEIGHVTVLGNDVNELAERAEHAAGYLNGRIEE